MRSKIGAATLSTLPMGKWLLPTGKQLLVCDRFSKQKNYPWLFLRYLKRLNQSQELDWNVPKRRNHVLFTCWVRHGANPTRNWTQCSKPNRILSAAVNVFLYFTLNKFKSTLKHWSVFFTCLQELFLTRSFQTCKPELLTSEREFAFLWEKWSHQRLPFQCQNLRLNHSCSAVERVSLIRLSEPSIFTTTFTLKLGLRFFSPLGNLSLCNRKHESRINYPERTQPKLFP